MATRTAWSRQNRCKPCLAHISTGTGPYWTSPSLFWVALKRTLSLCGLRLAMDPPLFYNHEGRLLLKLECRETGEEQAFCVAVTYYRMPSGNWEIVCYTT